MALSVQNHVGVGNGSSSGPANHNLAIADALVARGSKVIQGEQVRDLPIRTQFDEFPNFRGSYLMLQAAFIIFVWRVAPETRGKTVAEVAADFDNERAEKDKMRT